MNKEKSIIVYFSHSGNTRCIAEQIAKEVQADIFEIKPVHAYSNVYQECVDVAAKEKSEQARPNIASKIENLKDYDTIYLGFPNWWSTAPMVIFSFLEQHDFTNKNIKPFVTHGGGAIADCVKDIKRVVTKDAVVHDGIAIFDGDIHKATDKIKKWI